VPSTRTAGPIRGGRGIATSPDIPLFDLRLEEDDLRAVRETLESGWLTMGPRIQQFEEEYARFLGCAHTLATSSCTASLHLAYLAVGVGPGDEVVVPSMSFAATANAAVYCGGTPVFADIVGPHDLGLDPSAVEGRITSRTKAVCTMHYGGYPSAVDALRELCDARGLALIEDAAHAPSADYGGRKLGTWGDLGCFSFFSNKVLSVGEGGLVATDSDELAARVRSMRSHGMTSGTWDRHRGHAETYDIVELGFNYRMDEPRAALLLSRMRRVEDEIAKRRRIVRGYRERLGEVSGVTVPYGDAAVGQSSCYVMPVVLDEGIDRPAVRRSLTERGIQTSILYPAIHEFAYYRARFPGISLPRTEAVARRQLTLPLFPHMTEEQLDRVCEAVAEAV
jgi:dTDP-4-amino-4,6-dideoxygalactose transaminase